MHTLKIKWKKKKDKTPPNNSTKPYSHFGLAACLVLEKKILASEEAEVFPF